MLKLKHGPTFGMENAKAQNVLQVCCSRLVDGGRCSATQTSDPILWLLFFLAKCFQLRILIVEVHRFLEFASADILPGLAEKESAGSAAATRGLIGV